ncbi:hypothetical protein Tco_1139301 [Tanacetum coccineum]
MPTNLPTAPEVLAVSPFLCSDDPEFESVDESHERHVSLRLHDDVVSRWRDRVRSRPFSPSGSSLPDTTIPSTEIATASPTCISTPVIIASPAVRSRIRMTVNKSTLGLRPVLTPTRSVALHKTRRAALSLETSSSDTSSGSSSDLAPASSSSGGPSRKRSRSSATFISSTIHTARVLSPTRADLLPPHKRYRGTSALHSDESGDEGSPETWQLLRHSESEEAEADAEVQPEGTIEIGVDVATRIDTPDDLFVPAARIDDIESRQIEQEGRSMIADSERSGLLARVVALEGSNTRLQDAIGVGNAKSQAVALESVDAKDARSQNRDDNDNGSGGNGNHGNHNGDGNQNGGKGGAKRDAPVARSRIGIDEIYEMSWKDLMKLMIEVYCPRNEIQKLENEMVPEENDKIERMANVLMDQKVFVYAARNAEQNRNEKRGYARSAPYYNKCRLHHEGPCTIRCTSCKKGHFKSDCPKLKNQNRRNKAASNDARGRVYALGGADRSFVLTTFSALIDIPPTALDVSSFDVIIGMNWLSRYRAVIVCDEKIIRIPYINEILTVGGDGSSKGSNSRLSIISCTKTQKYIQRGCHVFLAQISVKKTGDKLKEKRLEDVPIVQDFPEVFLEDLPGVPPAQQVELQIDFVPGAAPVARAPY